MSVVDPGLQPERTELAWRRTALALAVGSLVALRLLPAAFSDARWALVGVGGALATGAVWHLARRRIRAASASLATHGSRAALPGAAALLALALLASMAGIAGTLVVLAAFVRA